VQPSTNATATSTRSARRAHLGPTAGIGREVAGDGMAVAGMDVGEMALKVRDPATAAKDRRWRAVQAAAIYMKQ